MNLSDTSIDIDSPAAEPLLDACELFGFKSPKAEQEELIRASVAGRDVLGVLPTGYGKSVCYQIPGILTRSKTLVISPLISLQEDQINRLRSHGLKAFALHSGLEQSKRTSIHYYFKCAPKDEPSFLYLSPELLLTGLFHQQFEGVKFHRLAVDEAHCVSTWGNSFRPDYQRIRLATMRMGIPLCSAFTATTDPRIEEDIRKRIPLRPDFLRVAASPYRPNLSIRVKNVSYFSSHIKDARRRRGYISQLLRENPGPAIIYCNTRSASATLYEHMRMGAECTELGHTVYLFHANLPYEDKVVALQGFRRDRVPLVIATSAFGMGIDRADIRQVIHYRTPYSLVDYAQQFGRAGRDGLPAMCTTFHEKEWYLDHEIRRVQIDVPTYDAVEHTYERLYRRVQRLPPEERQKYNLQKFMRGALKAIEGNENIFNKEAAARRMNTAVALLQKAGVIHESADGFAVHEVLPGSRLHQNLIDFTAMHERMLLREKERVSEFFGAKEPTQQLLWQIIGRGD